MRMAIIPLMIRQQRALELLVCLLCSLTEAEIPLSQDLEETHQIPHESTSLMTATVHQHQQMTIGRCTMTVTRVAVHLDHRVAPQARRLHQPPKMTHPRRLLSVIRRNSPIRSSMELHRSRHPRLQLCLPIASRLRPISPHNLIFDTRVRNL